MWYIYTMEYYSVIERNEIRSFCRDVNGLRVCYTEWSQEEKSKYILTHTAAAAAKSLQSCPTLCDPIEGSPPGSPVPGILQARTLEWVAISFSNAWKWKVKVKLLSGARLFVIPWTAAYQAPPSMGFSRQEYWSGLLLPSPINTYMWNLIKSGMDEPVCRTGIEMQM